MVMSKKEIIPKQCDKIDLQKEERSVPAPPLTNGSTCQSHPLWISVLVYTMKTTKISAMCPSQGSIRTQLKKRNVKELCRL